MPSRHHFKIQPFKLLILLSVLESFCFAAFDSSFLNLLYKNPSAYIASNDGVVPILKDEDGLYVNANLNATGNSPAKLMLSLVSNQTMLASYCWNFSQYDCNSHQCSLDVLYSNFEYPWFTSQNHLAKAFVSLDDSYWKLNNDVFLATDCFGNNQNIGLGRYGAIGLGYVSNARTNFLKTPLFSIWFDQSLENGILFFGNDTAKYATSTKEITSFPASQNWIVNGNNGYFMLGQKSFSFRGSIAFDINSDIPGFDTSTFNKIINALENYFSGQVKCEQSAYKPVCTYTESFEFPDFGIKPDSSTPMIPISSDWIYLDNTTSSFTLNIKMLSQNLNGANYITPSYDGTIVLDAKTMSRFYTVFNGVNQTIHLYPASAAPATSWEWLYILIFSLIGFMFIAALAFFAKKAMKESDEEITRPFDSQYIQGPPSFHTENRMSG